jgi:hypothetical protein
MIISTHQNQETENAKPKNSVPLTSEAIENSVSHDGGSSKNALAQHQMTR